MEALSAPDPIDVQVGLTIRRLRKERGISQEHLARAIGITFQQVQKYEKGVNRISASMLVRAAGVLGVQPADLLPRSEAELLPYDGRLLAMRGAEEVVKGYAAIRSPQHRRAVLNLIQALRETGEDEGAGDGDGEA